MIQSLITNCPTPKNNPCTFISCTNKDNQVKWRKTTTEKAHILRRVKQLSYQGAEGDVGSGDRGRCSCTAPGGLYLVMQVVAKFHPHNMNATNENVPLTKQIFNNFLRHILDTGGGMWCNSGHSMTAGDWRLAACVGLWN